MNIEGFPLSYVLPQRIRIDDPIIFIQKTGLYKTVCVYCS